ncbi:MAG TPA: diaminopimelate decarboxylase [Jiangellaceae bacterium]|nr:diaminopimelate decarboxylase [Jiangellaceae bacterium]
MRTHEAGALHAVAGFRGPTWLREPADVNALLPALWARNVQRDPDGCLTVAGVPVSAVAGRFGTPAYVVDEDDFRSRAREFRSAFDDAFAGLCGGADVYYAAKAFLCRATVRWVAEEGLHIDVCTGGELAVVQRAGFPADRVGVHGNNKSDSELSRALDAGVGRIVVDSPHEIERLARLTSDRGLRARVMVRLTVGVEAHTHEYIATAHEDQKFGFSLAGGAAADAVRAVVAEPGLELTGLHSHIGSQIFDTAAFEVAARRTLGLHAEIADEHGLALPELDLGGGFGIAYTSQDDPLPAAVLASAMAGIVEQECRACGVAVPRISVEPGRAIAGPSTFTLYEVGTVKPVELDAGATRTYVSVDGGMSDNIRAALYDADYSCTLANRRSSAPPVLARVVGKHCESGDIVVKDEFLPSDVRPGDLIAVPGTGAYARSLANTYNHVPRPPVVAVRGGAARLVVRRETEDELLRFDVDE